MYTNNNDDYYCESYDQIIKVQTNCSDPSRVGVSCEVNGYQSTVSKYMIYFDETIKACDDQIESKCFSTKTCKIHKHLMCNDKPDYYGASKGFCKIILLCHYY